MSSFEVALFEKGTEFCNGEFEKNNSRAVIPSL